MPLYFFCGGLAGSSAALAFFARLAGHERLARNATLAGVVGIGVSPALLISDLGRPERFANMLRVFKPTSPMSMGSWLLGATGAALGTAAGCEMLGVLPKLRNAAQAVAGILGLPLSTYTAALLADTAIPVWHEARRELPFLFAGSAAASAAGAALITTGPDDSAPARRMAVAGVALELGAQHAMEARLGELLAEPYREGAAGRLAQAARACTAIGSVVVAVAGRRRTGAVAGGALLLGGSLLLRFAVIRAGHQSARDSRYTVIPQRERARRVGTRVTTFPSQTVIPSPRAGEG